MQSLQHNIYTASAELTSRAKTSISNKHFRPGGMAPSKWTPSVRAVRETVVADYSTRSVKTTHHVTYRPPIAVLLFLLALSVS